VVEPSREPVAAPIAPLRRPTESDAPSPAPRPAPLADPEPAPVTRPPAPPVVSPGSGLLTVASWYAWSPPAMCWDGGSAKVVPRTSLWTAHKTLPCGTWVEIDGPAGSIRVQVWDRGPYAAGRDLDLSVPAFVAVAGDMRQGVAAVRWRVVP
jgi:hypothetical protein